MNQSDFENIKERYTKLYIVADDNTHKLIKTMKEDILALIQDKESTQAIGSKTFSSAYELFRAV